jgi:hypothetical protein
MRTENWQSNMRGLRLVGEEESGPVLNPYGPVRAGLTTSHRTQNQALSELLNCLEREVENLHSKYCEAYVTLMSVMDHLARLSAIIKESDTTDTL